MKKNLMLGAVLALALAALMCMLQELDLAGAIRRLHGDKPTAGSHEPAPTAAMGRRDQ